MPHQEKNNQGRYSQLALLLPIVGTILPHKTVPEKTPTDNSIDFHLQIIKKIDSLLKEHDQDTTPEETFDTPPRIPLPPSPPIEPRPPLSKTQTHTEITWQPTIPTPRITQTIPDEFKTELTTAPQFKFITSHEFTKTILGLKPRDEDRIEIIDLSTFTGDNIGAQRLQGLTVSRHHTSEKHTTMSKKDSTTGQHHHKKMEVIDARTLKQKTYEDVFVTAMEQTEEIEKKAQIYYLNSKGHKEQKQKKLDDKQSYIPVDFDERSKELKEQQQQEEEQKQQQEQKIQKQLEHEHEKLEKLENKKTKLEEKKHELLQKEKKQQKKEPAAPKTELQTKKQQREQKRLQRLELRSAKKEEQLRQKKEKQTLKEKQKQQHLKQKGNNKKQQPKKEKNTGFSLFKKEKQASQTNELDDDLKKVLLMTDSLLGELPQDVIDKFAQSDDFELYERVLNKYKPK